MSSPPEADFPYPAPGEIIDGKYRCERLIGVGGMGAVVQATHLLRKAPVALKFMNPYIATRGSYVERFINEAVAASRIDSEHVVKIFDVGQLPDGTPYLVMEYLEGLDLAAVLEQDGAPGLTSIPRSMHFAVQVLRGLQMAHDAGIIHRDMKPSNCFVVDKEGDPDFVKLLDFGISKLQQPDDVKLTQTNSLLGTPLYMAPEQARSAKLADHRSDLYAVGVILYELLTGTPPFDSHESFTELLLKIATAEPVPLTDLRPDVPPELASNIRRAFARNPDERYQSAFELSEALAPWCDERSRAVLDAARRRAARETGLPATMVSPGQVPPGAPPTMPAASGWPMTKTEVFNAPGTQSTQAGLATTASQPAPATPAAQRTRIAIVAVAVVAGAAIVAGVFAFGNGGAAQPSAPSASADPAAAPLAHDITSASASAPGVVVEADPVAPNPSAAASVTSSNPPTSQPTPTRHRTPRDPAGGATPPRLGDITIQK